MVSKTREPANGATGKPTMDFLLDYMRKHPDCAFADARAAAAEAGYTVYPINWGRAQVLLGRVKPGQGKAAAKKARARRAEAAGAVDASPEPAPRRRRSAPSAPGGALELPLADGHSADALRDVVDAINAGARAALVYRGEGWVIEIR
jgi:hypothetical protein